MVSFKFFAGAEKPSFGFVATHRIVVQAESDEITYWYVQQNSTVRSFDASEDRDLVELAHAKGCDLQLGQFESFAIGADRNYHLKKIDHNEFLLKSLC